MLSPSGPQRTGGDIRTDLACVMAALSFAFFAAKLLYNFSFGGWKIKTPNHYTRSKLQPRHVIRAWKLGFNLGNVVKYIGRAGLKGDYIEDLIKARNYINFEIQEAREDRKAVKQ